MSLIHEDIWIRAPAEDVFALLSDAERLSEFKAVAGIEREVSNFSGPLDQVGTTFVVSWRIAGIDGTVTNTIEEVVPPRLVRIRGGDGDDMRYRLQPEGDGTRLSIDGEYEPTGVLYRLIDRVVLHNTLERGSREFLQRMKEAAEAQSPVGA